MMHAKEWGRVMGLEGDFTSGLAAGRQEAADQIRELADELEDIDSPWPVVVLERMRKLAERLDD
jgi:hypothetical protein